MNFEGNIGFYTIFYQALSAPYHEPNAGQSNFE